MYVRLRIILLLILNIYLGACSVQRGEIQVDTSFGEIRGISDENIQFNGERRSGMRFLGIPYGKPPTGDRRFARPEPEVPKKVPHNATFYRPHCPQSGVANPHIKHFNSSEDCLYLNVFIPGRSVNVNGKYPVMIWIYGGLFSHGGADVYSGDILSAFNDVIVVTFNYRVNVFGFLDDGSGEFANNGLFDQKLAINWVHSHIQSFGGDHNAITLFGESAGGVSVIYQTFHDDNIGKIKRVIAQSGSPRASFAYEPTPKTLFYDFSARLNCKQPTTREKMECLKTKSTFEIVSKLKMLDPFLPSKDGEFLIGDPEMFLTEDTARSRNILRKFYHIGFMTGLNNKDGGSLVINYLSKFAFLIQIENGITRGLFESIGVPFVLKRVFDNPSQILTQATIHQYSDWSDPENKTTIRDKIVDLATDLFFLVPALKMANLHAVEQLNNHTNNNNTYLYQFSHKPWLMVKPRWVNGALHAWEIPYVFGLTDSLKIPAGIHADTKLVRPDHESRLSAAMMKYWTNFARTGNPNSDETGAQHLPVWPPYESAHRKYIDFSINMTSSSVKQHLEGSRVNFWIELVPSLVKACAGKEVCVKTSAPDSGYKVENGSTVQYISFAMIILCISHIGF